MRVLELIIKDFFFSSYFQSYFVKRPDLCG
jgi:hypothetical protein